MQTSLILLLVAIAAPAMASSCYSVYSPVPYYSLPATVSSALSSAFYSAPDIYTIGEAISTIEFASPSLSYVEYVIASYMYASPSIVSYLEGGDYYPSQVTDVTSFDSEASEYYTLATAIDSLLTIEAVNPSLASEQSTLQYVMATDSSITYYLSEYTAVEYSTVYYASQVIDEATLTSPSIVADYISVYTAVESYPSVSSAISSLSYYFYTLPSTVDYYVISYISSPSTVAPSEVAYIYYYYPSIYADVTVVTSFTYSYPSVVSALTGYLYVASTVSSIGSAVYYIISYEMPTFTYQESVIGSVVSTWASVTTDLDYISMLVASSSTLGYALSYIEGTFYDSPAVAYSLYYALVSPSTVSDPEEVSYEEMSHQSFVTAVDDVISFVYAYPSYESSIYYIMPYMTSAFQTQGTLLTAVNYLSEVVSGSTASATYSLNTLVTVETDWSTVLYAVSYATYYSPTLSCYENVIASFAYSYPTVVEALWSVITDVTEYSTEASYLASLEASYSTVVSAIEEVYAAAYSYTSLYAYEDSFIYAASSDSSALTQFYYYTSAASSIGSELWWYTSSSSSAASFSS